jgi:acetyl-CoA acetyltransferase
MSKQLQEAYIVAATRTPVGKAPRGAFRHTRPDSLLAHALRSVLAQVPEIDPGRVEDVIVGCAMPEYEQGMNVARIGLLLAGMPNTVAGMTVNRFCSSGLNAVSIAADRIRTGEADIMIAAGTESMSMIPMLGRLAINADVFSKDGTSASPMAWPDRRRSPRMEGVARRTGCVLLGSQKHSPRKRRASSRPRFRLSDLRERARISRRQVVT